MGWMHDTLAYLHRAPAKRRLHHQEITFGLTYAFTENFVLPLSHDEVVHAKGSLLRKIAGDARQKLATLRAYYAFMWAYPGKKLLFMGQEFAQDREWDFKSEIDWPLLDDPAHAGVQAVVRDCNRLYRSERALHASDCEPGGFAWLVVDDAQHSTFAWLRRDDEGARPLVAVVNFASAARRGYRLGLPQPGRWREILNTDATVYGGSGRGNAGTVVAEERPGNGQRWSAVLTLPPLAAIWLTPEGD
jgi:1,4-alpha-glucan branching enzyme